jgi:hypothetical protein
MTSRTSNNSRYHQLEKSREEMSQKEGAQTMERVASPANGSKPKARPKIHRGQSGAFTPCPAVRAVVAATDVEARRLSAGRHQPGWRSCARTQNPPGLARVICRGHTRVPGRGVT